MLSLKYTANVPRGVMRRLDPLPLELLSTACGRREHDCEEREGVFRPPVLAASSTQTQATAFLLHTFAQQQLGLNRVAFI
eukprot:1356605-Rhodomonas_salina.1